jgi:GH24 family phage-related lysozyme (muramidase)
MALIPEQHRRKAAAAGLAMAIAAPAEGIRQWAYYDPPGVLTVCRGHTGPDVRKDHKYSLDECNALFSADMLMAIEIVDRCQPGLPVNVLAAFADAVYNMGGHIACDTRPPPNGSTPARALARKDFIAACHGLRLYNKASVGGVLVVLPGLDKRRAREEQRCLTPEDVEIA